MSYEPYQALLEECEMLEECVKKLAVVLSGVRGRLPLRKFTVTFVIQSTGTYDDDGISESYTSDPSSAVVFARTPNDAREYILGAYILGADLSTMDAESEAELELADLLEPEIQEIRELAQEEGDLEEGDLVPGISFDHEIEIKSVVDEGLADDVEHADGEFEIKEPITT